MTALEMLDLQIYQSPEGKFTSFDERASQVSRDTLLRDCGHTRVRAIDAYVAKNHKALLRNPLSKHLKASDLEMSPRNRDVIISYLHNAINKAKYEAVLEASKIYWEYMVRRTYHFGFECCALNEV